MAGAGFKTFNTGDVLTAADVNTYLMQQTVLVFADAAARTTALSGVLAEGMISYLKDTNATEVYNGSAWVGITGDGDITGVTAGTGISGGGTSGTVTITNDMATTITAKGDLLVGTGNATYDNLAVGTNGYTLVADSGETTGLKWAAPSSGGMTSLASGSLSGTSVSLTSISGSYNDLILVLNAVSLNGTDQPNIRFNGVTNNWFYQGTVGYAAGAANSGGNSSALINADFRAQDTNNSLRYHIYNYASSNSQKIGQLFGAFVKSDATFVAIGGTFNWNDNAAITSIQINANYGGSSSFDGGTYTLYGVK